MEARLSDALWRRSTPLMRRDQPSRRILAVVLAVAGTLRLGFWALGLRDPSEFVAVDSEGYLALAEGLRAAYLGDATGDLFALGLVRPPGYPLLLAAASAVSSSTWFIALTHVALGLAVVWVTYLLGRSLVDQRVGLTAAAIVAVEPGSIIYSGLLLTEVPFTLLLVVAGLLIWAGLERANPSTHAFLGGLVLAAATLVRPVSLYLPLVLVPGLYLLGRRRGTHRTALAVAVAIAIGFALPVGGWIGRNVVVADVPVLSTIESTNLLYYRAAPAVAAEQDRPVSEIRDEYRSEVEGQLGVSPSPGSRYRLERSIAVRELLAHPLGAMTVTGKGVATQLLGPGRDPVSSRLAVPADHPVVRTFSYVTISLLVIVYLLAFVGAASGPFRGRVRALWLPVLLAGYLVAISAGGEAYSRFRVPAMPFLALPAGYAICHVLLPRFSSTRRGSVLFRRIGADPSEEFV